MISRTSGGSRRNGGSTAGARLGGDAGGGTQASDRSCGFRAWDCSVRKYFRNSPFGSDHTSSSFSCRRNGMLMGRSIDIGEAVIGDAHILLLGEKDEEVELKVRFG